MDAAFHKFSRWLLLLGAGFAAMLVLPASAQTAASQLRTDVVFTEYSALSSTAELVRRLYSPLSAIRLNQEAQRAGRTLRGQPIDLTKEHYSLYIPDHPHSSSGAYSLLVFIPPWPRPASATKKISAATSIAAGHSTNGAHTMYSRKPSLAQDMSSRMLRPLADLSRRYLASAQIRVNPKVVEHESTRSSDPSWDRSKTHSRAATRTVRSSY